MQPQPTQQAPVKTVRSQTQLPTPQPQQVNPQPAQTAQPQPQPGNLLPVFDLICSE